MISPAPPHCCRQASPADRRWTRQSHARHPAGRDFSCAEKGRPARKKTRRAVISTKNKEKSEGWRALLFLKGRFSFNLLPSFLVHIDSGTGRNLCRPPQADPTGHACTASADKTAKAGTFRLRGLRHSKLPPFFGNALCLPDAFRSGNAARRKQGGCGGGCGSRWRAAPYGWRQQRRHFPRRGPGRRPAASVCPFLSHSIRGGAPRLRSVPSSFLLVEKQVGAVGEDFVDFVVGEAGTALEGVDFVLRVHDGVVGAEDEAVSGVLFQNGPEHVVGDFLHA